MKNDFSYSILIAEVVEPKQPIDYSDVQKVKVERKISEVVEIFKEGFGSKGSFSVFVRGSNFDVRI